MRIIVLLSFVVIFFSACLEKEYNLDVLRAPQDYSIEEATDVHIVYSDSAQLRVKIEGPLLRRYIYRFRVEEEFPDGVHVTFYDAFGKPSSWLSAKYAVRKPQDNETIVQDSVVLYNTKGERLEGLELIWDEEAQLIHTDKFVIITPASGEAIYSHGFESNQDFSRYTLYSAEGDMLVEGLGLDEEE